MKLFVQTAQEPVRNSCWPDQASYRWMSALPHLAWAWEFLRRNAGYRCAYNSAVADTAVGAAPENKTALQFGLLRFEDPDRDALVANVFWRIADCHEVLPLAASAMGKDTASSTLNLESLRCRTTVCPPDAAQRQNVLLAQDGRSLQLAVFGDTPLAEALLLTPALPSPALAAGERVPVHRA